MDYFRRAQSNKIGHGGFKCPCCNDYRSFRRGQAGKHKLSHVVRSTLKRMLRRDIEGGAHDKCT